MNSLKRIIKVHYKGCKSYRDEWLDPVDNASRLAKLHTHTDRPFPGLPSTFAFKVGRLLDMLDSLNSWCVAKIVKIEHKFKLVKIYYVEWGRDEWVSFDSYRLAPRGRFATRLRKKYKSDPVSVSR
jgi:hypothetical protein